ncbi:hypothetical protein CHLNCDRAFT_136040 [Chlorella variabilis]|uniref:Peptidase S54 rhomboid domain-containing protein n=1 Tax=Chlorella variabilis TaxID=554065 RepID=E1ZJL8_CHLVA|nr:hypothetical protein CHLNCDRAFT_136040 [Chlorella variabilis]EFN54012.1 hypothetical protein CHLNCDRAFT_136040 [Chlorella variabilis]|eukprot:XP_005846114.1 hypothetical protein CHLNCDRAFT_136040 [Chlorella variabilis]
MPHCRILVFSCNPEQSTTETLAGASLAGAHQQSRGFARYLQFQTRGGGGGSGWGRWSEDSDKVLWGLIAANVGGFALWRLAPNLMQTHATVSIEGLRAGRVWTALTAAFSHKDVYHLGANMVGLYFFGRDVGRLFGGKRLLMLYMAGGVAGSLAHCGWYYYQACKTGEGRYGRARWFGFTPSALGASAAVNALTVCDILLYPTRTVLLYAIIPMPAALLGVLWLLNDVSGAMDGHRGHIAHAGHLGGAATGLAFFLAYNVSTSSTNATYMPAWEAPQGSPADAMRDFEAALAQVAPSMRLVDAASGPAREYRRYAVDDPLFDHDDIEVLISVQRPPYEADPPLVTFRSMAAQVKYVWPIQQAITDFGAQRQRLKEVRSRLGWRILGCDLLECFEE